MDIKTMEPEAYAQALREQGVPEAEIPERMAHDMLIALAAQLQDVGVPEGFEGFAKDLEGFLMETAKDETAH